MNGAAIGAAGRALDRLVDAMAVLAGALLAVVAALLCLDVAVRYAQVANLPWIGDVASVGLYAVTFLAAPWVLRENGHIAVTSLVDALPPALGRLARCGADVIGMAVCVVLCGYAVRVLLASHAAGTQVFKMLVYPQWWLFTLPPVTFACLALLFARRAAADRAGGAQGV